MFDSRVDQAFQFYWQLELLVYFSKELLHSTNRVSGCKRCQHNWYLEVGLEEQVDNAVHPPLPTLV